MFLVAQKFERVEFRIVFVVACAVEKIKTNIRNSTRPNQSETKIIRRVTKFKV